MFKKVLNIIVALLSFATTTGFTISKHYCGDDLISMTIDSKTKSCCGDESCNCCHNETEIIQLKEHFINFISKISLNNNVTIDLLIFSNLFDQNYSCITENVNNNLIFNDTSPPKQTRDTLAGIQSYLL